MASILGLTAGVVASLLLFGPLGTLVLVGACELIHLVVREEGDEE